MQQTQQLQFDFEALYAAEEPMLRPEEVARMMTVNSRTVARMRLAGVLPYIQISNTRFRYLKRDVIHLLKTRYKRDDYLN